MHCKVEHTCPKTMMGREYNQVLGPAINNTELESIVGCIKKPTIGTEIESFIDCQEKASSYYNFLY